METELERKDRRLRLAETLETNPQLWQDIEADFRWSAEQTIVELKGKASIGREWLSGYASGLDHAANLKRRMEIWKTENKKPKT